MQRPNPLPRPTLVVEQHNVARPRFTAIDAHNHLGPFFGGDWPNRPIQELANLLDEAGIEALVDLDGGFEDHFYREKEKWAPLGDRVQVFTGVGWKRLSTSSNLGERAAMELEMAVKSGAKGL